MHGMIPIVLLRGFQIWRTKSKDAGPDANISSDILVQKLVNYEEGISCSKFSCTSFNFVVDGTSVIKKGITFLLQLDF